MTFLSERGDRDRWIVALSAFAFHHPGLRLFFGLRQTRVARKINALFLGATLLSSLIAAIVPSGGLAAAVAAFVAGHFVWSAAYAWLVLRRFETTFTPRRAPK